MERDKQKKEQDERRAAQRKERLKKQRELELQRSPGKSKFDDMNSDASEGDDDDQDEEQNRPPVRKSRFDDDRRESRFDQRPGPDEPPAAEDSKSERYSIYFVYLFDGSPSEERKVGIQLSYSVVLFPS